jgi:ribose transport system permease protein
VNQSAEVDIPLRHEPPPMSPWAIPRRALSRRTLDLILDYGIFVALAALVVYFSFASPYFLQSKNLLNIAQAVAPSGILAAGLTIALIGGQVDLSVGAVVGVTSVIIALLVTKHGQPLALAIAVAVAVALLTSAANGILVVNVGINSIISTLAVSSVVRGVAFILAEGQTITLILPGFQKFIYSRPLGVPVPVYILIAVYAAGYIFLNYLRLGWHVYAAGGNPSGASRAGIPVNLLYRALFIQCSLLAALAGTILTARAASGQATFGMGAELDVLTAVLLGGIGLGGGAGRIERTLAGVLLIGVLANGLTLLNVPSYYQQVVRGIIFVLAVTLDGIRRKQQSR